MQAGLRHDEPRDAAPGTGQATLRRCIVSGAVRPREELLRFVVDADGHLIPDVAGRLPGRGIWLSADRDSVRTARARKLFQRAAHRTIDIDPDIEDLIERLLLSRCLELLGLARRAGQAIAGFEKVAGWLRQGRVALVLAARDAADDGREKLRRMARDLPVVDCLGTDELGRAFGRERTVHAAVAPGALATKLRSEARRLEGFRRNGRE